jgi:hypothetical protein
MKEVNINTTHFQDRITDVRSAPLMPVDITLLQVNEFKMRAHFFQRHREVFRFLLVGEM